MDQTKYIDELNKIRGLEMRMSLVYYRLSQVITGPWRDSLAESFVEHAEHETKHANLVMRRIVALGGKVGTDLPEIPEWSDLSEILSGLEKLEREGVDQWNDLLAQLDSRDPFRHVVEDILVDEQEHLDEAIRWRADYAKVSSQDEPEAVGEDIEGQPDDPQMVAEPQDPATQQEQPEEPGEPLAPVGDTRRLQVFGTGANYLDDELVGDAWQQEDGTLTGTGLCYGMVFEPFALEMYRSFSIGMDMSPLAVLRLRLAHSPFVRLAWEDSNE